MPYTVTSDALGLAIGPVAETAGDVHEALSRARQMYETRRCIYHSTVYQTVLRISIRDPENLRPKRIIVPDREAVDYLQDIFPRSKVEKIDIGPIEEPAKRRGRPKRHESNKDRLVEQRARARERKAQMFMDLLRLNSQDVFGKEGWVPNGR